MPEGIDVMGIGDSTPAGVRSDKIRASAPDGVNMQRSGGTIIARNEWLKSDLGYAQDEQGVLVRAARRRCYAR
jgi:hypothetical protein